MQVIPECDAEILSISGKKGSSLNFPMQSLFEEWMENCDIINKTEYPHEH